MKTGLSIFLLIIFSFQVLPVKQIGKMLFKQQLTEEIGEFSCDDTGEEEAESLLNFRAENVTTAFSVQHANIKLSSKGLQGDHDNILKQYIADTPTPPPNC